MLLLHSLSYLLFSFSFLLSYCTSLSAIFAFACSSLSSSVFLHSFWIVLGLVLLQYHYHCHIYHPHHWLGCTQIHRRPLRILCDFGYYSVIIIILYLFLLPLFLFLLFLLFCFCVVSRRVRDMKLTMRKREKNLNLHLSKSPHHILDSYISDHPPLWTIIFSKLYPMT